VILYTRHTQIRTIYLSSRP